MRPSEASKALRPSSLDHKGVRSYSRQCWCNTHLVHDPLGVLEHVANKLIGTPLPDGIELTPDPNHIHRLLATGQAEPLIVMAKQS